MERDHEPEHVGSIWKHPYLLYVILTVALFGLLVIAGWLALESGILPQR